jgi:exodeoxyribonuclease VII large subunit
VRLLLDHRLARLNLALRRRLEQLQTAAVQLKQNLTFYNPRGRILENRSAIEQRFKEMSFHLRSILETDQHRLQSHRLRLESLSPLAVLARGYSITYRLPEGVIVRKAAEVETGNRVHVQLGEGALECLIENKRAEGLTSRKEFNRGDQEKA